MSLFNGRPGAGDINCLGVGLLIRDQSSLLDHNEKDDMDQGDLIRDQHCYSKRLDNLFSPVDDAKASPTHI